MTSQDSVPETAAQLTESVETKQRRIPLFSRQCPRCESDHVHRSHRRSWLERLAAILVLPYRCEFCSFRFFRAKWIGR